MPSYLIRVAPAHNLPLREAPVRGMTIDPVRTPHSVSVFALVRSIWWYHDSANSVQVQFNPVKLECYMLSHDKIT